MGSPDPVRTWSTDALPKTQRLDYWMSALQSALWPVTDFSGFEEFSVEMREATLGALTTCEEHICAHQARRTRRDVARTAQSTYHLFMSLDQSWSVAQRGCSSRLRPGDVVLVGDGEHETSVAEGFYGVILKCPESWLRTWLPDPEELVGRPITCDSHWGRVLSPMVSQLTPQLAVAAPLPHQVLTDQLGTTLALVVGEAALRKHKASLRKIVDCIAERCTEPQLSALDVAASLNISPAFLHRTLAAHHQSFAGQLSEARIAQAAAMLSSQPPGTLTLDEVAKAVGFLSSRGLARRIRAARLR